MDRPAQRNRAAIFLVVACVGLLAAVAFASGVRLSPTPRERGGTRPQNPPNILLLLIDDADVELLSDPLLNNFPTLRSLSLGSVRFRNAFVTTPLCGPSRAAVQRGQYGHRSKILTNSPGETGLVTEPSGGFNLFFEQSLQLDTLATRLDDAGYHTMLVGKYLHTDFPGDAGHGYVPPGWDEFYGSRGGVYYETNRYINGVSSNLAPGLYRTDVERDDAVELLSAAPAAPWFMLLAPFGVHVQTGADPMFPPRHAGAFTAEQIPAAPDLFAPDEWGLYSPINQVALDRMNGYHRDRMRAMLAIDEMIAAVVQSIEIRGELGNTVIVVTSDNGILLGHHLHEGKSIPYDRALRVPLWIRGPGFAPAQTERLATLADLLPTFIDFARAQDADYTDGISLRPVLGNPDLTDWRTELLAEGAKWHRGGAGLKNVADSRWTALITERETYVEFADGRFMFHDHETDPFELVPSDVGLTDRAPWQRRLAILEQCAAAGCRRSAPETAIGTPQSSIVPLSGFSVDGFASAPRDLTVTEIRLVLRHPESGLYWNGTDWQPGLLQIQATLDQTGEDVSSWSYAFAGSIPEGEHLNVTARAYDSSGQFDASVAALQVTLSAGGGDRPETTLMLPSALSAGTYRIAGWVVDKSGVDRVELEVNGEPIPVQLGVEPRHELLRTWTAEVTLLSGANEIVATGIDGHGLADLTPASYSFVLP